MSGPYPPQYSPPTGYPPQQYPPGYQGPPPGYQGPPQNGNPWGAPPPVKPKRGCFGCLLRGCLVLVVLVIAMSVGGYFAIQNGLITPNMVLNLIGIGPATVQIDNFRDDKVTVELLQTGSDVINVGAQPSETPEPFEITKEIGALDITSLDVPEAGRYRLTITAAGKAVATCTMPVKSGDRIQIVLLPKTSLITRNDDTPSTGSELVLGQSSLCR